MRKFGRDAKSPCYRCPCGPQSSAWAPVPVQASLLRPTGQDTALRVAALEEGRPPPNGTESTTRAVVGLTLFSPSSSSQPSPEAALVRTRPRGSHVPRPNPVSRAPPEVPKVAERGEGQPRNSVLPGEPRTEDANPTEAFSRPLRPRRRERPPGRFQRRSGNPVRSAAPPSGTRLCNPVLSPESLPRRTPTGSLAERPRTASLPRSGLCGQHRPPVASAALFRALDYTPRTLRARLQMSREHWPGTCMAGAGCTVDRREV